LLFWIDYYRPALGEGQCRSALHANLYKIAMVSAPNEFVSNIGPTIALMEFADRWRETFRSYWSDGGEAMTSVGVLHWSVPRHVAA
jgi:hypothetical protein